MSLAEWVKNGWLRPHKPSKKEIKNLFEIVERDLKDASSFEGKLVSSAIRSLSTRTQKPCDHEVSHTELK